MTLEANTRLGRYEIRSKIGAGGMGDVYVATDSLLGRDVAIKVFASEFGREAERLTRFVREAKAASALNHPGILTVFDVGKLSGMYFIVTELVEGLTLREWVKREQPSKAALVNAIRQAALALDVAHRAGIVHRDIKPENLMRRSDGLVKVLDFGIAKMIGGADGSGADEAPLTEQGALVGTVRYMSPEQASGKAVDGRTDIWSLGIVLYELASGRRPFDKPSPIATVVDIVSHQPVPFAELMPDAPEELVRAVERAMSKEPDARFQTAREMADALEEAVVVLAKESGAITGSTRFGNETIVGSLSPFSGQATAEFNQDNIPTPPAVPPTNLALAKTKLIGRVRELADILSILQTGDRLLTLTGPGGTGKTRLSMEAARELHSRPHFPDGVFFVDLSPLSQPELITGAVGRAVGMSNVPRSSDELGREIANKRLLLVLDNFEHLQSGATIVSDLLEASPAAKVLATSRSPLQLSQEREYPLDPLELPGPNSLPPIDDLARVPAVELFVERARRAKPAFELKDENARAVVEICRKLEGLPLALELAAARIKLLTPHAMLDRLDHRLKLLTGGARDLPDRQQTMRGAVDWSYDLLDQTERAVFRRLAVFSGGCTLAAAETVCGIGGEDVLEVLGSLVNNSLVKQRDQEDGEARFSMLEVVREYAGELLEASDEASAVRLAAARYFKQVVEDADASIRTGDQVTAVRRLIREQENIKAALSFLLETQPADGAAMVGSIQSFWSAQGYSDAERRVWLKRALSAPEMLPPTLRSRLLNGLSRCEVHLGRADAAVEHAREAVEAARGSGDWDVLNIALGGYGNALSVAGDLAAAQDVFKESVEIARQRGSAHSLSVALGSLGEVVRMTGDLKLASDYYDQALNAAGAGSRSNPTGIILANLGGVSLEQGDFDAAEDYYRQSLAVFVELENMLWASVALNGLAAVALHNGNSEKAAVLAGAAEALCESGRSALDKWEQSLRDRYVAELGATLDPGTLQRYWQRGRAMTLQEAAGAAVENLNSGSTPRSN